MASVTFPKAQNGGITALGDIKYSNVIASINNRWVDITGSDGAGAADTFKDFCEGFPVTEIRFRGSASPGGNCAKGQSSTVTLGTTIIKPQIVTLGRAWPLVDVTGSTDTEKGWDNGIGQVYGSIRGGKVLATGPNTGTLTQTVAFDIDQIGTLTGTTTVDQMSIPVNFAAGTPIDTTIPFRYKGAFTYAAAGTIDIDSILAHTVLDPPKVDLTLDLDTGETITNEALLYQFQLTVDMQNGGPIGVAGAYRFDQADVSV